MQKINHHEGSSAAEPQPNLGKPHAKAQSFKKKILSELGALGEMNIRIREFSLQKVCGWPANFELW
jgi:hypothetical protein